MSNPLTSLLKGETKNMKSKYTRYIEDIIERITRDIEENRFNSNYLIVLI